MIQELAKAHLEKGCVTAQTAKYLQVSQMTIQRWNKQDRSVTDEQKTEHGAQQLVEFVLRKKGTFLEEIINFKFRTFNLTVCGIKVAKFLK